jgi:hypothetical protein
MKIHKEYIESLSQENIDLLNLWCNSSSTFVPGTPSYHELINIISNAPNTRVKIKLYSVQRSFESFGNIYSTDRPLRAFSSLENVRYLFKNFSYHNVKPIKSNFIIKTHPSRLIFSNILGPFSLSEMYLQYLKGIFAYERCRTKWYNTKDEVKKTLIELYVYKNFLCLSSEKIPKGSSQEQVIICPSRFIVKDKLIQDNFILYSDRFEDKHLELKHPYKVKIETVRMKQQ